MEKKGEKMRTIWGPVRLLLLIIGTIYFQGCSTATTSGTGQTDSDVSARIYEKDFDTVFFKAVDATSAMGWQITFTDKSTGVIAAKTPTNLWTWGDNVSIRLTQIENSAVKVDVSSGTPNQVIDWGRNKRNILSYYGKLDSLLYPGR